MLNTLHSGNLSGNWDGNGLAEMEQMLEVEKKMVDHKAIAKLDR